jgi:hypothetical protein
MPSRQPPVGVAYSKRSELYRPEHLRRSQRLLPRFDCRQSRHSLEPHRNWDLLPLRVVPPVRPFLVNLAAGVRLSAPAEPCRPCWPSKQPVSARDRAQITSVRNRIIVPAFHLSVLPELHAFGLGYTFACYISVTSRSAKLGHSVSCAVQSICYLACEN